MKDSVNSLVEYINTIKPYHTKILDVTVQYKLTEDVSIGGTISTRVSESITFTLDT